MKKIKRLAAAGRFLKSLIRELVSESFYWYIGGKDTGGGFSWKFGELRWQQHWFGQPQRPVIEQIKRI
ncbi:hypothetical protein LBR03_03150 [Levilactobacillus brevis]|nr:hypothetical protein LBR03_03150 [Levilactobacillus brevis]